MRRETQFFFYDDCFIQPNKCACAPRSKPLDWPPQIRIPTHFVQSQISTLLVQFQNSTNSSRGKSQLFWTARPGIRISTNCFFRKITQNHGPSLPGMMSFTSPAIFPIWGFYCDICDCHILSARA